VRASYDDQFVYFSKTASRLKPTARQTAAAEKKSKAAAGGGLSTLNGGDVTPTGSTENLLNCGGGGSQSASSSAVGNSVFDWYKDLSKIDKGREFGGGGQAARSSREAGAATDTLSVDFGTMLPAAELGDSDVIDMVYDMMPKGSAVEEEVHGATATKVNGGVDAATQSSRSDSSLTALFSSVDMNALFPSGLADLDDISDSDLLQSDYATVAALLNDLASFDAALVAAASAGVAKSNIAPTGAVKSDRNASPQQQGAEAGSATRGAASAPPELVTISMYWNDLPGLVIQGQQYIRLVDIHRQVLPAKETAILKKRCQMFGFDVVNCTDMQRDFLIRYANAAKSKSTWIVSRSAADKLIGFYIDPRIKSEMEQADRLSAAADAPPPFPPAGGARGVHAGNCNCYCICYREPCRGWRSLCDAVVVCMLVVVYCCNFFLRSRVYTRARWVS
jgi:hypothetical protein